MELKGGDKLSKALADIAKKMSSAGSVSIGFMPGALYPDGETDAASVAFWNEFGTSRIPARPFFRTTIAQKNGEWAKKLGQAVTLYEYDTYKVLKFMGETVQQDVQESINTWSDPANAESTIAKKGFNSPLRDTMHMHKSVEWVVDMP